MPCSCCSAESLDIFSEKGARRELRRYLENGLGGGDARLIAAWAEEGGLEGETVVEVGGGIGQIQAELLRRGATAAGSSRSRRLPRPGLSELARGRRDGRSQPFVLADLIEDR